MKGLRKYLTPFAPDQSGAVSVLYEMGGILVICDAGGCVGNICGFDEPRWQKKKSAVFSAGLRDMDAIMGRDELLIKKLSMAAERIDAKFAALIGTPVPAVIGTDYHALLRMAERKLSIPVLTIDTDGMELCDRGAKKAYLELVRRFVKKNPTVDTNKKILGILGCNPLDTSDLYAEEKLRALAKERGYDDCLIYGSEDSFSHLTDGCLAEKNLVIAPSGLAAAEYIKKNFDIPYETENPLAALSLHPYMEQIAAAKPAKILIVDQQVTANSMRKYLRSNIAWSETPEIIAAGWFMMEKSLKEEKDIHLTEEDQFEELVRSGGFDMIIGDPVLKNMTGSFDGLFIEKNQFALSGKMDREER